jgi:hypothetical protein
MAKKIEKRFFYKCVLEFNFASVSRIGTFNFLKKVKIFVPQLAITVLNLAHSQATKKFLRRLEVTYSSCLILSGVHSIMTVNLAQLREEGGTRHPPFTLSTITVYHHHEQSWGVRSTEMRWHIHSFYFYSTLCSSMFKQQLFFKLNAIGIYLCRSLILVWSISTAHSASTNTSRYCEYTLCNFYCPYHI